MESRYRRTCRQGRVALVLAAAAGAAFLLRGLLLAVLGLVAGGAALAFLAHPVARRFERRLSRPAAALAALVALGAALALGAGLIVPALARELAGLAQALPRSLAALTGWSERVSAALSRAVPGLALPGADLASLAGRLPGLASGTVTLAVGAADGAGRLSLMVILGYFFLRDRDAFALRLELLIPRAARGLAVRMARAVGRELRLYLQAELLISLSVGALAAAGLALVGVRGAAALGPLIGLLNMIPYFGPFIGGVPAVLIALGDGPKRALLALAVLCAVQQLDGSLISPRIMGSVTGLSPALVLVGLFAGARLAGVWGMLLAIPAMIVFRTLFRVYVQRSENI